MKQALSSTQSPEQENKKAKTATGKRTVAEHFVSEPLIPVTATSDTSRMAIGEPGLPRQFLWRGRTVEITAVLRSWRETGKCRHGSAEMYVRKHWYEVATVADGTMTIYFDRHSRRGLKKARWWLLSIRDDGKTAREGKI